MTKEQRTSRIDQIIAEIKAKHGQHTGTYRPAISDPVAYIYERKAYEQRLSTMRTQILIGGGTIRPEYEDGN